MQMKNFYYFIIILFFSCKNEVGKRQAGVCISFDDRSVKEWKLLIPLFDKYQVKTTFFITHPDSLSQEDILNLKELETDGHEIAFHGNHHFMAENYIKENSYREYWQFEVVNGLDKMKKLGFNCQTFAYPYGAKYWFTDFLLLRKFSKTRGVCPLSKDQKISEIEAYYQFDHDPTLSALSFDEENHISFEKLAEGMDYAKNSQSVLLLYGHIPSQEISPKGYSFSVLKFEKMLQKAHDLDLKFYTFKDLN